MPAKPSNPQKAQTAGIEKTPPGKRARTAPPGEEEKIRQLAYQKWEAAGKPDGDGLSYWLEAEQELSRA